MTVVEAFHCCWADYWDSPRFHESGWAKEVQGYFRRRIEKSFLAGKELSAVTPADVKDWHHEISSTGSKTEANRAMEVLSRLFTFAQEQSLISAGFNPCRLVRANTERSRDRFASADEIRKINSALHGHWDSDPRGTGFLFCLMLTGARPSALERARRADIRDGILYVAGKNFAASGRRDAVALPDIVMDVVLTRVPRRRDGLLFGPGLPQRLWEKVRTEAGCHDLWARDLRRTFATFGFSGGVQHRMVGELLGHRSSQTTMIYARLMPQARLAAANRIAEGLVQAMGIR